MHRKSPAKKRAMWRKGMLEEQATWDAKTRRLLPELRAMVGQMERPTVLDIYEVASRQSGSYPCWSLRVDELRRWAREWSATPWKRRSIASWRHARRQSILIRDTIFRTLIVATGRDHVPLAALVDGWREPTRGEVMAADWDPFLPRWSADTPRMQLEHLRLLTREARHARRPGVAPVVHVPAEDFWRLRDAYRAGPGRDEVHIGTEVPAPFTAYGVRVEKFAAR